METSLTVANPHGQNRPSLEDRLDEPYAEAWRPAPGESLIGEVVAIDQRISAYDGVTLYPVVTVRKDNGDTLAFHGYHAVAKAELGKQAPAIGERIGIKYIGKPPGKAYEAYRIIVERDGPAVDWAQVKAEGEAEQQSEAPDDSAPF
jgi:hypothetical protein